MMQAPEHRLPDDPARRVGRGRAASRAETFQCAHLETHLKGQPDGRFPSGVPAPPSGTEPLNWSTSGYPDPSRGPDRPTTGQVSMKGNGSGRRLWNCLRDRHHGDMETYGRPAAPVVAPGIRHGV
jgi:hypothetical protein